MHRIQFFKQKPKMCLSAFDNWQVGLDRALPEVQCVDPSGLTVEVKLLQKL